MELDHFKEYIKSHSESEIYHEFLLGQLVWFFLNNGEDHSSDYDEFKKFISKNLNIPFNNISIVGSAKTRFSLSPNKLLKEFDEDSDFDLIIVSNSIFKDLSLAYRKISSERHLHNYNGKSSNVFNGFVSIKDSDKTYGNESLISWQRLIRTFKSQLKIKFNIQHDINYRIYSDWRSVEDYHLKGIRKLKGIIDETN